MLPSGMLRFIISRNTKTGKFVRALYNSHSYKRKLYNPYFEKGYNNETYKEKANYIPSNFTTPHNMYGQQNNRKSPAESF